MQIKVILGAMLSDIVGKREVELHCDKDAVTVAEAAGLLLESEEGLEEKLRGAQLIRGSILNAIFVVDNAIVKPDSMIKNDTVLKILPPIAGG